MEAFMYRLWAFHPKCEGLNRALSLALLVILTRMAMPVLPMAHLPLTSHLNRFLLEHLTVVAACSVVPTSWFSWSLPITLYIILLTPIWLLALAETAVPHLRHLLAAQSGWQRIQPATFTSPMPLTTASAR